MTHWILSRVILFLVFAAAGAGTHYKSLADQHRKPGHHWADHPRFRPSWPEFYTPKGLFYLKLGRGLQVAAFVIFVLWIFY